MIISVEIKPEVEARLAAQATARGMDLTAYVASLLEQAVRPPAHGSKAARSGRQRRPGRKSLAQLFADSPFRGLDLDFERDRDSGRHIEL